MVNPIIEAGVNATKHAILRTISVLCVIAVLALIGLGIKRILYPPKTESYAQQATTIFNVEVYNPEDTFFFGIKIFGIKFGITKPTVKKIKEITEEVK